MFILFLLNYNSKELNLYKILIPQKSIHKIQYLCYLYMFMVYISHISLISSTINVEHHTRWNNLPTTIKSYNSLATQQIM